MAKPDILRSWTGSPPLKCIISTIQQWQWRRFTTWNCFLLFILLRCITKYSGYNVHVKKRPHWGGPPKLVLLHPGKYQVCLCVNGVAGKTWYICEFLIMSESWELWKISAGFIRELLEMLCYMLILCVSLMIVRSDLVERNSKVSDALNMAMTFIALSVTEKGIDLALIQIYRKPFNHSCESL